MQFQAHVRSISSLMPTQAVVGKQTTVNNLGEEVIVDRVEYGSLRDRVTFEIEGSAPALGDELGYSFAPPAELFVDSPPGLWTEGQRVVVSIELAG